MEVIIMSKLIDKTGWSMKEHGVPNSILTVLYEDKVKIKVQEKDGYKLTGIKIIDLEGNEINVNDGNTYIQICPIDAEVLIEGNDELKDISEE